MSETDHYKHGDMDIHAHEKTFAGFVHFITRVAIAFVVFIILLAMFNA